MSKRVLIILAVGFVAILAAFFLYKHECNQTAELYDLEAEPEPEPKPKRNKKTVTDEPKEETAAEPAAGTDEQPGE